MTELVSNRLFVRANTVLDYTWGRKFVHLFTEGLAGTVKGIFVRVRLFHERVLFNDALVSFDFLALSLCRTAEAEMVANLKSNVAIHVRVVVHVIKDVLRRSATALNVWILFIDLHFLISNVIRFIVICNRLSFLFFNWTTRNYF